LLPDNSKRERQEDRQTPGGGNHRGIEGGGGVKKRGEESGSTTLEGLLMLRAADTPKDERNGRRQIKRKTKGKEEVENESAALNA